MNDMYASQVLRTMLDVDAILDEMGVRGRVTARYQEMLTEDGGVLDGMGIAQLVLVDYRARRRNGDTPHVALSRIAHLHADLYMVGRRNRFDDGFWTQAMDYAIWNWADQALTSVARRSQSGLTYWQSGRLSRGA